MIIFTVTGCGGSQPPAEEPEAAPPPAAAAPVEPSPPPEPWEQMSFEARKKYMGEKVLPVMTRLFKEHDAAEFAAFSCDTCHGEDMAERKFDMPSPALPALHATGTPEQQQMVRDHPDMVRFMFNRVVPAMQTMLGASDFDPETGEGFSCYYCHPRAEDTSAPVASASGG